MRVTKTEERRTSTSISRHSITCSHRGKIAQATCGSDDDKDSEKQRFHVETDDLHVIGEMQAGVQTIHVSTES